jgi:hypothetical protein
MARFPTKTIVILALTTMLGACSTTVPVARKFPDIPESLNQECGSLQTVGKTEVKLSELLTTVTANYGKYHECSAKLEAWREWYNEQKRVFDSVK